MQDLFRDGIGESSRADRPPFPVPRSLLPIAWYRIETCEAQTLRNVCRDLPAANYVRAERMAIDDRRYGVARWGYGGASRTPPPTAYMFPVPCSLFPIIRDR